MEFELVHQFEADPDTFVKAVFFDEELNRRLAKMKNISAREVKSLVDKGDTVERVMFIEVAAALPKEARKLVGEKLGWNEIATLDRATRTVDWKIDPQVKLPLECHGKYEMIPEGDNKVRRVITGEVKVRIPLLGKSLEKFIVNQLVESFEDEEAIVREYLRELSTK